MWPDGWTILFLVPILQIAAFVFGFKAASRSSIRLWTPRFRLFFYICALLTGICFYHFWMENPFNNFVPNYLYVPLSPLSPLLFYFLAFLLNRRLKLSGSIGFRRFFTLELRKQRNLFFSSILLVILSWGVIFSIFRNGLPWAPIVVFYMSVSFVLFVVLILAVLLGVQSGSNLRREPQKSAEEALPVHPVKKLLGAWLASFLYLAALGVPVFVLAVTGSQEYARYSYWCRGWGLFAVAVAAIHLHLRSFLLSYWLPQPVFAGGLAALFAAGDLYFAGNWFYGVTALSIPLFGITSVLVPGFAWLGSLILVSNRVELGSRAGLLRGAVVFLLITSAFPTAILLREIVVWIR